jgi:hypothetical protein
MPNLLILKAAAHRRSYITPEDVSETLAEGANPDKVRLDLLELLGGQTETGVEDKSLCAFIAWKGVP